MGRGWVNEEEGWREKRRKGERERTERKLYERMIQLYVFLVSLWECFGEPGELLSDSQQVLEPHWQFLANWLSGSEQGPEVRMFLRALPGMPGPPSSAKGACT